MKFATHIDYVGAQPIAIPHHHRGGLGEGLRGAQRESPTQDWNEELLRIMSSVDFGKCKALLPRWVLEDGNVLASRRAEYCSYPEIAARDQAGEPAGIMDINMTSTVLDNGLKVLVQEMHTAPLASVWCWYKVGSKDERPA